MKTQNIQVIRIGDWICLKCNNLNFSFRQTCNRCQNQTKESNDQDIINIQKQMIEQQNYRADQLILAQRLTNTGFNNKLLITPPKILFNDEIQSSNENRYSNQKDEDIYDIYKQLTQDEDNFDFLENQKKINLENQKKINLEKIIQIDQRIPKNSEYNYFKKIAPFNMKINA